MIQIDTHARAGILGNPSDGYFGKTISIPVRNFKATLTLFEWDRIEIFPGPSDNVNFDSLEEMISDMKTNGYYGGFRLVKAAIKVFHDYMVSVHINLPPKQFAIKYSSNIPRQVGLAGSSAIITSTMKALSRFFELEIDPAFLATLVLWAETKELGISAGLQDRVVQVYDAPVFMDFDKKYVEETEMGIYSVLDSALFPNMYLAFRTDLTHKPTCHNDVHMRWKKGDQLVIDTMREIGGNASHGLTALESGNLGEFDLCMNRNFDLRSRIYNIHPDNKAMIELARSIGATAKFPGSGGAVVGTYASEEMFTELTKRFKALDCTVIRVEL